MWAQSTIGAGTTKTLGCKQYAYCTVLCTKSHDLVKVQNHALTLERQYAPFNVDAYGRNFLDKRRAGATESSKI